MAQFTCTICNEGFEQKSRYDRHMASSHPAPAPSAADVEKSLKGIDFPKSKPQLLKYASRRAGPRTDLYRLVKALPERTYRDAAEVAVALGELKAGGRVRSAKEVAAQSPPSRKGGKAAARRKRSPDRE